MRDKLEMERAHGGGPIPRGTLADKETSERIYLFKNVSALHATYQVRLLLYKATTTQRVLVLRVPLSCRLESDLQKLCTEHPSTLVVEEV